MSENHIAIVDETSLDDTQALVFAVGKKSNVIFSSRKVDTQEEKALMANAMINPDFRVADYINQIILLKDIYIEQIQMPDQKTGEMRDLPRIVLFDKDGKAYGATSYGIFSALRKVVEAFGDPRTWTEPLAVKVKQVTRGENKMLSLEVVIAKK